MFFSSKKGEFDRFFNRLDRPVEESQPDRQPDRFPFLTVHSLHWHAVLNLFAKYVISI